MPVQKSLLNGGCEPTGDPRCWKSADNIVGLDNTKTNFAHTYTIDVTLSDGSVVPFNQTPTTGFTQQIEQWATALQAALPGCLVEPRCNLPGGCGGLLPPPTGAGLGGMFARYVSIICCPGSPYPVSAEVVASPDIAVPRALVMDAKQGVEQRGWLCVDCDGNEEWFNQEWQPLDPADIPTCWFECAEELPEEPQLVCSAIWTKACDNGVQDGDSFLEIDVLWDCCDGRVTLNDYFTAAADGSAELYTPIGDIVDCDTVGLPGSPKGALIQAPSKCSPCDILDCLEDIKSTIVDCSACAGLDLSCETPRMSMATIGTGVTGANSSMTTLTIGGTNILAGNPIPAPITAAAIQARIDAAGKGAFVSATQTADGIKLQSLQPCGEMIGVLGGQTVNGPIGSLWRIAVPSLPFDAGECAPDPGMQVYLCNAEDLAQLIADAIAANEVEAKPHIVTERICFKEEVDGQTVIVPKIVAMLFDCRTGAYLSHTISDIPDIANALDCCTEEPIGG